MPHPMDETHYLLACLSEECAEVIQRIDKAHRFGLDEVQPGQELDNRQRLANEVGDLLGVLDMLRGRGTLHPNEDMRAIKPARIRKYMELSRREGRLA